MLNYKTAEELWHLAMPEIENPAIGAGLHWWPKMNEAIGGLRPHELTLLCAPTGAGKSQLLANISAQLLISKVSHFVAPVETGDKDYITRVVSALIKNDLNDCNPRSKEILESITNKIKTIIEGENLFIAGYEDRVDIKEMINLLKYMYSEHRIKVALLDNLNFFLKITSSDMERAEMDAAMHEFVMLSKRIPIHTVLIVHPRKTEGGRVVSEFDIKGSSLAVQESSNCAVFNRPEKEDLEKDKLKFTDRELIFRKIRKRGINVGKPFYFQYSSGRYEELSV